MMKRNFILLVTSILIMSCNSSTQTESVAVTEDIALEETPETYNSNIDVSADAATEKKSVGSVAMKGMKGRNNSPKTNSNQNIVLNQSKKIIQTGSISINSTDVNNTLNSIRNKVKNVNGYFENEVNSINESFSNHTLTIRIPSESFDSFINGLEENGDKITEKNIKAEDVSIQYYDTESRLQSKRGYLEKYQQMVSSAKSVDDLLQIQEQIRMLQEDIESTEGILRSLKSQISYSTISINIFYSDSNNSAAFSSFGQKVKEAFSYGWELIENLFLFIVGIWPILLILIGSFFFIRKYRRGKRIHSNKDKSIYKVSS